MKVTTTAIKTNFPVSDESGIPNNSYFMLFNIKKAYISILLRNISVILQPQKDNITFTH